MGRESLHAALAASALVLSACISAPPAPLDPGAAAERLTGRTLQDPEVTQALAKAQLPGAEQSLWSLDALTVAAWALRADVAVAAADVASGTAAERVARQLPNPSLSLGPGYLIRNANNNVSPWVVSATLGFTLESGGKRRIRTAQARASTESLRWQLAETLWRTREEVRTAVLARELTARGLALAEQEVTLRSAFAGWVDTEIRFGAASRPERLTAETNLAQAQAQLRTARGEASAAEAELGAALGIVEENVPIAQLAAIDLDALPDPAAIPQATWREWGVLNRLSVRHALADYEVAEQDLRMAVAKQYPDISFGPGYTFDKGDSVINLGLGWTLPLFHTERAQIDTALAARQKAAAQFGAVQARALAEVDTAVARYRAGYDALMQSRAAELSAQRVAAAVQRQLELGAADRGELLTAQLNAAVARRATLDAQRAAYTALTATEDSVQRPVWPASGLQAQLGAPVAARTP